MIIWIDGTFGVGKSTVTAELEELFALENPQIFSSDEEWISFLEKDFRGGGCFPQNNSDFICIFRKRILDCLKAGNLVIVDMALTDEKCKNGLLDELQAEGVVILHFILTADEQIIKERILNDELREQKADHIRKITQNRNFLLKHFKDAIWLDTEEGTPAKKIFQVYKDFQKRMGEKL